MITVRLPSMLRQPEMPHELHLDVPLSTIDEVVWEVDHRFPGFATAVDDTLFNFAVNDSLILHDARQQPLHHGDVVEVIPIIAGG